MQIPVKFSQLQIKRRQIFQILSVGCLPVLHSRG